MSKRLPRLGLFALGTIAAVSTLAPSAHALTVSSPTPLAVASDCATRTTAYLLHRSTHVVNEGREPFSSLAPGYTDTGIWVRPGDKVVITPTSDTIWAGLWFTGRNGPNGMTDRVAQDAKFPLVNGNDACGRTVYQYSLLAEVPGQTFQVGYGQQTTARDHGTVRLRINDDMPDNGDGFFKATVSVYRTY